MNAKFDTDRLAFDSGGSGPPALFIHGFGSNKFTWRKVCRGVEDIFSYFAIDLPGSGDSPAPERFLYSLENLSRALIEFISKRDLTNLTLVTHSLGASIALMALLQGGATFASRVSWLCIIDGIAYPQEFPFYVGMLRVPIIRDLLTELVPPTVQAKAVLKKCYFDESLITDEQVNVYATYLKRADIRRALKKTARLIDQENLSPYASLIKSIRLPCLLIWGKEDRVVPLEYARRLQQDLSHAKLVVIDRCGHMPQEERPDRVIKIIREFYRDSKLEASSVR